MMRPFHHRPEDGRDVSEEIEGSLIGGPEETHDIGCWFRPSWAHGPPSLASSPPIRDGSKVAVLPHEGTFSILYGSQTIPVGAGYRPGYISRPDEAGQFPVVVLVPGLAGLGSAE